ncbi:hypothetical protein SNE40_004489 [Patella caerulea]|uniref:Uncharacterized protein n=1 Tax=Patella caerulea TaxID=87958 RepID=A0AAN8QCG5_PATCE
MDLKLKRIQMQHQAKMDQIQIEEEIASLHDEIEKKSLASKKGRHKRGTLDLKQYGGTDGITNGSDTYNSRRNDAYLHSAPAREPQTTSYLPVREATREPQVLDSSPSVDPHPFTQIVKELKKPKCEVKKFGGNILEYRKFMRQLNTNVMKLIDDFEEKMSILESYTYGKANKIVIGYSHMDPEIGFRRTIEDFEELYGDSEQLAAVYSQKALAWPIIRADDPKGLDEYFMFLCECQHAMEGNNSLKVMEYSGNLQKLVAKLPFYIQDKWRIKYQEIKDKRIPIKFEDLVNLVRKESKKANDPVYGKDAMKTLESEKR